MPGLGGDMPTNSERRRSGIYIARGDLGAQALKEEAEKHAKIEAAGGTAYVGPVEVFLGKGSLKERFGTSEDSYAAIFDRKIWEVSTNGKTSPATAERLKELTDMANQNNLGDIVRQGVAAGIASLSGDDRGDRYKVLEAITDKTEEAERRARQQLSVKEPSAVDPLAGWVGTAMYRVAASWWMDKGKGAEQTTTEKKVAAAIGGASPAYVEKIIETVDQVEKEKAGETETKEAPKGDPLDRAWQIAKDVGLVLSTLGNVLDEAGEAYERVRPAVEKVASGVGGMASAAAEKMRQGGQGRASESTGQAEAAPAVPMAPAAEKRGARSNGELEQTTIEEIQEELMGQRLTRERRAGLLEEKGKRQRALAKEYSEAKGENMFGKLREIIDSEMKRSMVVNFSDRLRSGDVLARMETRMEKVMADSERRGVLEGLVNDEVEQVILDAYGDLNTWQRRALGVNENLIQRMQTFLARSRVGGARIVEPLRALGPMPSREQWGDHYYRQNVFDPAHQGTRDIELIENWFKQEDVWEDRQRLAAGAQKTKVMNFYRGEAREKERGGQAQPEKGRSRWKGEPEVTEPPVQETDTGRTKIELPRDVEQQRARVRQILDWIEESRRDTVMDYQVSGIVKSLEASMREPGVDESVKREVAARLEVYDSWYLMQKANGWIRRPEGDVGYTIGTAATEAMQRGHDLKRSTVETLFREGLVGHDVAGAWNLWQGANLAGQYRGLVAEAERAIGRSFVVSTDDEMKDTTNFQTDTHIGRKGAVEQLLVQRLQSRGIGKKEAEKSLEIAHNLAVASLETSAWNKRADFGNDQLAEIIHLREWRKKRAREGRAHGPGLTVDMVSGFGNSWLRTQLVNEENERLKVRVREQHVQEENGNYGGALGENAEVAGVTEVGSLDIGHITEGSWVGHCTIGVSRYHELRNLLMDERPKPEFDVVALRGMAQHFRTADRPDDGNSYGPKKLKLIWALGVVDSALLLRDKEVWEQRDMERFHSALTREDLSDGQVKGGVTFLKEPSWDYIAKGTSQLWRTMLSGAARAFRAGGGKR